MRKLMRFTLGFGASCGLCAYVLPISQVFPFALAAGIVEVLVWILDRSHLLRRFAAVSLGLSLGFLWYLGYHHIYLSDAVAMDGETSAVTVRLTDYTFDTGHGSAADGIVVLNGTSYQSRIYFRETMLLNPGDTLSGEFRFRVTTPEGSEEPTYHKGRGIFLILYQTGDLTAVPATETSWQDKIAILRQNLKEKLEICFPPDTYPFTKALLLGDTNDLSYAVDSAFKVSGIRHVVAVSGLHVSILFALLSAVTLKKRFFTALAGFPALFLFAALAGFTPSISRSCLMWALMLTARLLDKNYDSATALSFAALIMLMVNPLAITDVGFQLSVGSVAGIYLFSEPIRKWMSDRFGKLKKGSIKAFAVRWLTTSGSITLSAMSITTPLSAMYFGTVSLVGVLTNLLTLWVISFIFYGILGVCFLSLFWQAGGVFLAGIIAWPIRYVLLVAKVLADIPLAAVYTRSPYMIVWLVFVYLLLFFFLFPRNRKPLVLFCCAIIGLCLWLIASWTEPMLDDVRFTVLNVGQGQCLLLQSEGRTFMVDCGGDMDEEAADIAAETLLSQGISKLDGLILTHLDRDHAGGAEGLLSRVDTELLILPAVHSDLSLTTKGEILYAVQNMELTFGAAKISIFPATYPGSGNENSLCVLFDSEKCDILITGDRDGFGERSLLRNAHIPKVDILVAGHHGSKYSTCEELLAVTQPEIVCISAGKDNAYGHPAPELLERLEIYGCTIYRTDIHGEILIRR